MKFKIQEGWRLGGLICPPGTIISSDGKDRWSQRAKGKPVPFELPPLEKPADSVAAAAKIAAGVASGELTPSEAAELATVVEVYVRAIETKVFDERLAKVENAVSDEAGRTRGD